MRTRGLALALATLALAGAAGAQQAPAKAKPRILPPEQRRQAMPHYGQQLMTPDEIRAYDAQLAAAKTPEERERIRQQHHQAMQARAKERGVALPPPPAPGARP